MTSLARALIHLQSAIVPASRRAEWRAEWLAELSWVEEQRAAGGKGALTERAWLLFRVLGALPDAWWLRRRHGRSGMLSGDVKFSLRAVASRPSFGLTVVLTLALGIGAATAVFSVVDALVLRAPPFHEPERLVELLAVAPGQMYGSAYVDVERAEAWRAEGVVFEEVRAHSGRPFVLTGGAEPLPLRAAQLEPGFLGMLGVRPQLGRDFAPEEATPGRDRVILLGDGLWRESFGADPGVVGSTVRLNGEPYTVIGVLPSTVRMLPGGIPQAAVPLIPGDTADGGPPRVALVGRLRSAVTVQSAQARLDGLAASLESERPREQGWRGQLRPMKNLGSRQEKAAAIALSVAVLCLLLIACANAAGLLLVRGATRRQELEIRAALGAGAWPLARLLLVESAVLTAAACLLGLGLAYLGMRLLLLLVPENTLAFSYTTVTLNDRVLAFAVGASAATGILFGLAPAIHAARSGSRRPGASRTATSTRSQGRARSALLVAEVVLTMLLLVGAGLMTRSFLRLIGVESGMRPETLLVMWLSPSAHRYPSPEARRAFLDELHERLRATPGVQAVSLSSGVPPSAGMIMFGLQLEAEGLGGPPPGQPELLPSASVDTAYFSTLGIPILDGRAFALEDRAADVAIIDQQLARFLWGSERPIGKRFRRDAESPWLTVIGIAGDVKLQGPDDRTHPFELYQPSPSGGGGMVAIRTGGPPADWIASTRATVRSLDAEQPIIELTTAEQRMREAVGEQRFTLVLMNTFAAIALVLAAVGIYGLVSYTVAQRTREIGIRVALGAPGGAILSSVLGRTLLLVGIGTVLGAASALGLSRFLSALLFQVPPADPVALVAAVLALTLAAVVALAGPMVRAMRIAPTEALRLE